MNALYVVARTVQFMSGMLLFGGLVFIFIVARRAWSDTREETLAAWRRARRVFLVAAFVSIVTALLSGAAWLLIGAAQMTSMSLERVATSDTLKTVLLKTVFGRAWVLRLALLVLVAMLLPLVSQSPRQKRRPYVAIAATILAAAYVATLAWAGHAAAGAPGIDGALQLASDMMHLVAAAAWLGALPPLVYLLRHAPSHAAAADATTRFSTLGMVSVAIIVLSGIGNTWYLVGSIPALIGTDYGRTLMIKIAVFVGMLALAATNRWRLTPRMIDQDSLALRAVVRNARLETALGVVVLMTVAWLGITVPAAHETIRWPFAYTLSWSSAHHLPRFAVLMGAAAAAALLFLALTAAGVLKRRRRVWEIGLAGFAIACVVALAALAVPAYPTTYVASPVRYTVDAIARGADLYAASCAACHGRDGHGDGPNAPSLPVKPADLTQHVSHHPAGELYWMIAHGVPQRSMPAFSPAIADKDIWNIVRFLRAKTDADEAIANADARSAQAWRAVAAPDFTFEFAEQGQESLQDLRGRFMTLVIFYTLPQSAERLAAIARDHHALMREGLRTIALPVSGAATPIKLEGVPESEWIFPTANANVATAYMLFAQHAAAPADVAPSHVEFLIDRNGYIRARWIGMPIAGDDRMAQMQKQIEMLDTEKGPAAVVERHGH